MADNDQNDEYKFEDSDEINLEVLEDENVPSTTHSFDESGRKNLTDVKRNALIAVGLLIIIIIIFKLLGSLFSSKNKVEKATVPPIHTMNTGSVPSTAPPLQPAPLSELAPIQPPAPGGSQISQKLSVLEVNQQTVRSQVMSVSSQLEGVNLNVNDLTSKIAALSQMVATLTEKVDEQSQTIARLTARTVRPKPPIVPQRRAAITTRNQPTYYIQAVIPGRAWLITENSTATLTVREGTVIAGYGTVKLIDPLQGRVLTSSGRVIRFSQQDS